MDGFIMQFLDDTGVVGGGEGDGGNLSALQLRCSGSDLEGTEMKYILKRLTIKLVFIESQEGLKQYAVLISVHPLGQKSFLVLKFHS